MKIGDEIYVHGYVDEIRNGTIIIRNEGGYFGTAPDEVMPSAQPELIEQGAYVRGFEQGRTQGMIDAQPERKTGRWVPHDCNGYKSIDCDMCSECGERFYQIAETGCDWKYCPNCGVKMEGKHE